MFKVTTKKTKYGYRVTVYENGDFYAAVDAPDLETAKQYAGHYITVALDSTEEK